MRSGRRLASSALLVAAVIALAACDNAETRAQKHFESAMELIAAGDVDRAALEFRNVFKLDPTNAEARIAYGDFLAESGNARGAMQEYIAASELLPENIELNVSAATYAIRARIWDQAERQMEKVTSAGFTSPRADFLTTVMAYRDAVEAEDDSGRRAAVERMAQFDDTAADPATRDEFQLDAALRDGELVKALTFVDARLEAEPDVPRWHEMRLQIMGQMGDREGIRSQLETMIRQFPDQVEYATALVQYLLQEGQPEDAEAILREAVASSSDPESRRLILVAFLRQTKGGEAALAELDTIIAETEDSEKFEAVRAGIIFDIGRRDEAISTMEAVIGGLEDQQTEDALNYKVALASMLATSDNLVGARAQIEAVLAADPGHVAANKMLAAWLIQEDRPGQAIVSLRTALDQAPQDAEIMSLMADAYLRDGSRGLAGEMLSLAVEASGQAPAQSLTYARFLLADENLSTAESVLIDALRVRPNEPEILQLLGQTYIAMADWPRVEQVEGTLRRLETESTDNAADALRLARLRDQNRGDEAMSYLEELAGKEGSAYAAKIAIARTHIENRDFSEAESFLDEELRAEPDAVPLKMLLATVYMNTERPDEARKIFRGILGDDPSLEPVWQALFRVEMVLGNEDAARAVLDEGQAALPDAPNLLWTRAGILEQDGDYEGAIAIYEQLYERLPNSPVIANNLASLITTYRDSEEDLERAFAVAKRLRDVDVPAFQDTFGWIAFRMGLQDDAIAHLEPAAEGLPQDPIVQYHLARAYEAGDETAKALAQYRKAVQVAGPADTRPQIVEARESVARLGGSDVPSETDSPPAQPDAGAGEGSEGGSDVGAPAEN